MKISAPLMSNEELVIYLSSKTRACAEVLYDRYANVLFLTIIRIVPQKEIAEDILERTFIKAWNSFESYSIGNGTFLSWMMGIAHGLAKETLIGSSITQSVSGAARPNGSSGQREL